MRHEYTTADQVPVPTLVQSQAADSYTWLIAVMSMCNAFQRDVHYYQWQEVY